MKTSLWLAEESNPGPAAYKVTPLDPGLAASMKGLRKRTCASSESGAQSTSTGYHSLPPPLS